MDCGICGTVRSKHVGECTVCILKAEHVLIRKEIERISEGLDEMKKNERSESLQLEVGRLSKWVSELRREGSVRKKVVRSDSVETRGSCRQEVEKGQANGRGMGVSRPSDSPRQECKRGRAIEADRTADRWCVVENRSNKIRIMRDTRPVTCSNRFSCLSDGEESEVSSCDVGFPKGKTEALLIGDSQIRYLDRTFRNTDKRKRMRVCYPGARVNDIVDRIDREIADTNANARVIVHVGTNDIGYRRSEELIASYRNLIERLKVSGRRCIVSGILPRLGAGLEWESRAFGLNERVRSLCLSEDIGFLDHWEDFQDKNLFARDGVHLSREGVQLLSYRLERCLQGN